MPFLGMASVDTSPAWPPSEPRVEPRVIVRDDRDENGPPRLGEALQALLAEARYELAERRLRLGPGSRNERL